MKTKEQQIPVLTGIELFHTTYHWHTVKDKKYWEVAPFQCKVTLPTGKEKTCTSSEEYETLIKIYMEK